MISIITTFIAIWFSVNVISILLLFYLYQTGILRRFCLDLFDGSMNRMTDVIQRLCHRQSFTTYCETCIATILVPMMTRCMILTLSNHEVQLLIGNMIVIGMNLFLRQPNLDEHILLMSETIARTQPELARMSGEDFPKIVTSFLQGMFKVPSQPPSQPQSNTSANTNTTNTNTTSTNTTSTNTTSKANTNATPMTTTETSNTTSQQQQKPDCSASSVSVNPSSRPSNTGKIGAKAINATAATITSKTDDHNAASTADTAIIEAKNKNVNTTTTTDNNNDDELTRRNENYNTDLVTADNNLHNDKHRNIIFSALSNNDNTETKLSTDNNHSNTSDNADFNNLKRSLSTPSALLQSIFQRHPPNQQQQQQQSDVSKKFK